MQEYCADYLQGAMLSANPDERIKAYCLEYLKNNPKNASYLKFCVYRFCDMKHKEMLDKLLLLI